MLNGTAHNVSTLGIQREEIVQELEVGSNTKGRSGTQDGPHRINTEIPRHQGFTPMNKCLGFKHPLTFSIIFDL